ncbi:MAG: hypothetical protein RBT47_06965 [Anaerolineae bacterium]|nr:hypothetical protein [Anaerolineae bacterium]
MAKLEWYKIGNQRSDRQWRNILGVLKIQGERPDFEYLRRTAGQSGVSDLLGRALAEVKP